MPSVRLVDVTKRFGEVEAIDDVSFQVVDGEYLCVLGPTGSGKTTLLRLIAGLTRPDQGKIYIDGKLVNEIDPEDRNAVYVPQQYALFPHMTALGNVAFGPLSRGRSRQRALKTAQTMLDMMRLGSRVGAFPQELSGGMQQRVALARGLASDSKLLLLDEPLGALDARLRVELRYQLSKLAREAGLTVLHVTHDQEEALSVADRVLVLRSGRIQQAGTPFNIYNNPQSIFVADFVGGSNFLEGIVRERGRDGSTVELREGYKVRVRDVSHLLQERVVVAVRLESVHVRAHSEFNPNELPGEILSRVFLGAFVRYDVGLDSGDMIASRVFFRHSPELFDAGRRVVVDFSPEDATVYTYPYIGISRELEVI